MDIETQAKEGTEKALTPFRQFITDVCAKINGDNALKASVTELTDKLTKAEATIAEQSTQIAKLTTDLTTAATAHTAEIARLNTEHATALAEASKTAGAKALAKTGVHAVNETALAADGQPSAREQYAKLQASGDAAAAGRFYAEHRDAILSGR